MQHAEQRSDFKAARAYVNRNWPAVATRLLASDRWCRSVLDGSEALQAIRNVAVLRADPCAYASSIKDVLDRAARQAATDHLEWLAQDNGEFPAVEDIELFNDKGAL